MPFIGDWFFDPGARRLIRDSDNRRLSPKAAEVLEVLAEAPGHVWRRAALLDRVWPDAAVGEEVLTHAIAELRRAFNEDFRQPKYVGTVHRGGYRLLAPVRHATDDNRLERGRDTEPAFDLHAYADFLRACEIYEAGGRSNTTAAADILTNLVAAWPNFVMARAWLAKAMAFLYTYSADAGLLNLALEHSSTARSIGPDPAEALAAEGLVYAVAGDAERSLERFMAALSHAPESSEAHHLLGRASFAGIDTGIATLMFERSAQLRSDDYSSLLFAGKLRLSLGNDHKARLNYANALPRIEIRLTGQPDDPRALCAKARCLWHLGRPDEAWDLMEQVARAPAEPNYHLACAFARVGEHARALDLLEEVIAIGWRHKATLDRDPDFDALREDRRFRRISESII